MSESTRAYIYRGVLILVFALGTFGVITQEQGAQIVAIVAGFLGAGLAVKHTSTKKGEHEA